LYVFVDRPAPTDIRNVSASKLGTAAALAAFWDLLSRLLVPVSPSMIKPPSGSQSIQLSEALDRRVQPQGWGHSTRNVAVIVPDLVRQRRSQSTVAPIPKKNPAEAGLSINGIVSRAATMAQGGASG
jgi:hypothetical protein